MGYIRFWLMIAVTMLLLAGCKGDEAKQGADKEKQATEKAGQQGKQDQPAPEKEQAAPAKVEGEKTADQAEAPAGEQVQAPAEKEAAGEPEAQQVIEPPTATPDAAVSNYRGMKLYDELLPHLPADTDMVMVIDGAGLIDTVTKLLGDLYDLDLKANGTIDAIAEATKGYLGFNPLAAEVVAVVNIENKGGLILKGDLGLSTDGLEVREEQGVKIYKHKELSEFVIIEPDLIYFGHPTTLLAVARAGTDGFPSLVGSAREKMFRELLTATGDGDVLLVVSGFILDALSSQIGEGFKAQCFAGSLGLDLNLSVALKADKESRDKLMALINQGLSMARAGLGMARFKLSEMEPPQAALIIIAANYLEDLIELVMPKDTGELLLTSFRINTDLPELATSGIREFHRRALALVPRGTGAVVTYDVGGIQDFTFNLLATVLDAKESTEALRKELSSYLTRTLGMNVMAVKTLSLFWCLDEMGLLAAGELEPQIEGTVREDFEGHPVLKLPFGVYMASLDDLNIYGSREIVEKGINKFEGRDGEDPNPNMVAVLDKLGEGLIIATLVPDGLNLELKDLPPNAEENLAGGVSVNFGTGIQLVLKANPAIHQIIKDALAKVGDEARAELAKITVEPGRKDEFKNRILKAVAERNLDPMLNKLALTEDGDFLSANLNPKMFFVGIMAAIAIPSFVKYVKKSKTTEALANIQSISRAAVMAWDNPQVDESGELLPPSFPPSTGPTPGTSCCLPEVDKDGNQTCDQDSTLWDGNPTWTKLMFNPRDETRFTYEFKSWGQGNEAGFEVLAYGDLDCDGVMSTYKITGTPTSGPGPDDPWTIETRMDIENDLE